MGIFNRLTGSDHNIDANYALDLRSGDGFSHEDPGDLSNFRTLPLDRSMNLHTAHEAGQLAELEAQHTLATEATVQAYKAKAKVAGNDAKLQSAYRDYQLAEAEALGAKVASNAKYVQGLHGVREKYGEIQAKTLHQIQAADFAAKYARGRVQQILEGSKRL